MITIILVSLIGVVISIIIGTVWHSPKMWGGKIHMEYIGFSKLSAAEQQQKIAEAKPHMWKTYVMQMVLSFFTSFFIVFVLSKSIENGEGVNMFYSYLAFVWLSFTVPLIGGNVLWGPVEGSLRIKKFLADSIYHLITYGVVAWVASLFFV